MLLTKIIPSSFANVDELKECIRQLPIIRKPLSGLNSPNTVVACLAEHLDEAIAYYKEKSIQPKQFYILGHRINACSTTDCFYEVFDINTLTENMDIHLYFIQHAMPVYSGFTQLVTQLSSMGIYKYSYEYFCSEKFWRRNQYEKLSENDWNVVFSFTNILEDLESKHCYLGVIKALIEAEPGYIPLADYRQYFHPLVKVEENDVVCEGGPNNGATTLAFFKEMNFKGKIYAFEPMEKIWDTFLENISPHKENLFLEKSALWSKDGFINLAKLGEYSSYINEKDTGEGLCPTKSIDSFFEDKNKPTCIKLDVEGAETHVIKGAKQTISTYRPKLLISTYHRCAGQLDQVEVPRLIVERISNGYTFYCGQHRPWYAETIIYAKKK